MPAVRDRQQEASRKGTTYKPTESERSLMSRTGGLGARAAGLLAGTRNNSSSLWRTAAR